MRQLTIQAVEITPQIVRPSATVVISVLVAEIIPSLVTVDGRYLETVNGTSIEVLELET